jgi:hypothetical protein
MDDAAFHRRKVLQLLGGAGFLALASCASSKNSSASGRTTSTTTSTTGAVAASCSPIPGETAGPFPGDGSNGPNVLCEPGVVRRDITKSFGTASVRPTGYRSRSN